MRMVRMPRFALGVALAVFAAGCAKADEPKAPPPASSGASAITADAAPDDVDASGVLRALPMPQKYPHVVWDAAGAPDAGRGR